MNTIKTLIAQDNVALTEQIITKFSETKILNLIDTASNGSECLDKLNRKHYVLVMAVNV